VHLVPKLKVMASAGSRRSAVVFEQQLVESLDISGSFSIFWLLLCVVSLVSLLLLFDNLLRVCLFH
jgi:hypothetical protein